MATAPLDSLSHDGSPGELSIEAALRAIESRLSPTSDRFNERRFFTALGDDLRRLHAQTRIHHAAGFRRGDLDASINPPPEQAETLKRLECERRQILGDLDRLIRASEFVVDASLEDRDVFVLRVKELLAMMRRHHAEEDRLFFLAVWRDTGGES